MTQLKQIGISGYIAPDVIWRGTAQLGHASCVGYPVASDYEAKDTIIGDGVVIGAFCLIERGATLDNGVSLDHYCRIGYGSIIGKKSQILYGAQLFENCQIGDRCIVGGCVDDRAVIENDVTYMGMMAHSYREPGTLKTWDLIEQPSPLIRQGAVVGQNALIIGGIEIGKGAYVAAGEIVKHDVPNDHVLYHGKLSKISEWRGILKARTIGD